MSDFSTLLLQGQAWLFLPSAVLLGALHGLEPGHSKTMMAAFIVAVRGTVAQAVLLGLAVTVSHTAVVWAVAMAGLYFGSRFGVEGVEPYLQVLAAVLMVGVALWMMWRTWHQQRSCFHDHGHEHNDDHDHDHDHAAHAEFSDPHAQAHALQMERRFVHRQVTTGQIVMFGLTGGLIPCPASITVLLLCLQLKKIALGSSLVLAFSVGLALTMVASGILAAWGVRHASQYATQKWGGLSELAHKAPYVSGGLIVLMGLYVGYQGVHTLQFAR